MAVTNGGESRLVTSWVHIVKVAAAVLGALVVVVSAPDRQTAALALVVLVLASLSGLSAIRSSLDATATSRSFRVTLEFAVASVVVVVTGGVGSGFVAYLVMTVLAGALALGRPAGVGLATLGALLAVSSEPGLPQAFLDPGLPLTMMALFLLVGFLGGGEGDGRDQVAANEVLALRRTHDVLSEAARAVVDEPERFDETTILDELSRQAATPSGRCVAFGVVGDLVLSVKSWDGARGSVALDGSGDDVADDEFVALVWPGGTHVLVSGDRHLGVVLDQEPTAMTHTSLARSELALANARLHRRLRDAGADQERRRLAADLHDGLAQSLAQLRFELDVLAETATELDAGEIQTRLQRLVRQSERSLGDARGTITGLRATVAGQGLVATIRAYVRDVAAMVGPGLRFEAATDAGVEDAVAQEILLIVQEAVANALRHARADTIIVRVDDGPADDVDVTISDDGAGFDVAASMDGDGMSTMKRRADRVGVGLHVTSGPAGSQIRVRVPAGVLADRHSIATPSSADATGTSVSPTAPPPVDARQEHA